MEAHTNQKKANHSNDGKQKNGKTRGQENRAGKAEKTNIAAQQKESQEKHQ